MGTIASVAENYSLQVISPARAKPFLWSVKMLSDLQKRLLVGYKCRCLRTGEEYINEGHLLCPGCRIIVKPTIDDESEEGKEFLAKFGYLKEQPGKNIKGQCELFLWMIEHHIDVGQFPSELCIKES